MKQSRTHRFTPSYFTAHGRGACNPTRWHVPVLPCAQKPSNLPYLMETNECPLSVQCKSYLTNFAVKRDIVIRFTFTFSLFWFSFLPLLVFSRFTHLCQIRCPTHLVMVLTLVPKPIGEPIYQIAYICRFLPKMCNNHPLPSWHLQSRSQQPRVCQVMPV